MATDMEKTEPTFSDEYPSSDESESDDSDSEAEAEAEEYPESESDVESRFMPGDDPEENKKKFKDLLNWEEFQQGQDKLLEPDDRDEEFNFPEDKENWREEDLKEFWADAPYRMLKPGWDPYDVDTKELRVVEEEIAAGRDPPIAPFYVPFRKYYPVVPENFHDMKTPQGVIEELDRIEEFLKWVSYIFEDGSSYEGTVWDDAAHGKGVYVGQKGLVRYEGEWFQNQMEGHGVVEVDIPDIEPRPGSKLEKEMRSQGKIIARDYMAPEDREWLEKDIEDSYEFTDRYELPFYERDEWITYFGQNPEKGRYRYAGEWKHNRMHGCGVYEVNERTIYGRFYFGEPMEDSYGCDEEQCALHSGIAEVAAAKARMFINKPDGMVREKWGPYSDPQHHYFYEEEDVWMAPGFINQFYEVPDFWKTYVQDVDEEREMWLNSFYRSPLRLPMPPELSYWWENEEQPEFVLVNKDPEPDPEDPSKLVYTEDPLILHTPTGRLINYVEDEEHGLRLFWQPPLEKGEDVDPNKVVFLPVGNDTSPDEENMLTRLITKIQQACKPLLEKIEKWSDEKKKDAEMKIKLTEKELELFEAEMELKEVIKDIDEEFKRMEKEEERKIMMKAEKGFQESQSEKTFSAKVKKDEGEEEEEEEEEDDDDDDEGAQSSFGSVIDLDSTKNDQKGNQAGSSPFAASSLSFAARTLVSMVPSQLQLSFSKWKELKSRLQTPLPSSPPFHFPQMPMVTCTSPCSSSYPCAVDRGLTLRAVHRTILQGKPITKPRSRNSSIHKESTKSQGSVWHRAPPRNELNVLSLHTPLNTSLL
ncbi:hypothetical protein LguiA_021280 [Lonicera macranthoides]